MFVTLSELEAIVRSLKSPSRPSQPETVASCFEEAIENGYGDYGLVADIFYYSDDRLEEIREIMPIERWCEIFSISSTFCYRRLGKNRFSLIGDKSISVEDLAFLLTNMERAGYSIDPLPLVSSLLPKLSKCACASETELGILTYKAERHKKDDVSFRIKSAEMGERGREDKFKTATGYKVTVVENDDERPIWLIVTAPKYRRKPEPKLVKCEICGFEWYRGNPESSAEHRRVHRQRLRYLDPTPKKRFKKENLVRPGLFRVTADSSKWAHEQVFLRALAFKKESGCDFVMWHCQEGYRDSNAHGYLFINSANIAVGACAFRLREYQNTQVWGLQWIWIAPKYRRSGVLTTHWNALEKLHSNFLIEGPISDDMAAFLKKNRHQHQVVDAMGLGII